MNTQILARDGWMMQCPFCTARIAYTLINNQHLPVPFFYAEDCNDVLLRKSDQKLVDTTLSRVTNVADLPALESIWLQVIKLAPLTNKGGRYGLWSNVKCPACATEFPYNDGSKNLKQRIFEPRIVLIDGASLIGDTEKESWRICVRL